ncbi:MAG: hypothetical protein QOF46_3786 [Paraburkholderia sp.]|nr:hypothetical protein [Paraburkholderia sp.]
MLVALCFASSTDNRRLFVCGFVPNPAASAFFGRLLFDSPTCFMHRHSSNTDNKKDASTARVFFDEIPYRLAFAQSPDSFHLPPTISTITRARWSRPAWSFALMLKMPWEAGMSFVFSSAARSASRNAGVPG